MSEHRVRTAAAGTAQSSEMLATYSTLVFYIGRCPEGKAAGGQGAASNSCVSLSILICPFVRSCVRRQARPAQPPCLPTCLPSRDTTTPALTQAVVVGVRHQVEAQILAEVRGGLPSQARRQS